jgi:hypothetical protein
MWARRSAMATLVSVAALLTPAAAANARREVLEPDAGPLTAVRAVASAASLAALPARWEPPGQDCASVRKKVRSMSRPSSGGSARFAACLDAAATRARAGGPRSGAARRALAILPLPPECANSTHNNWVAPGRTSVCLLSTLAVTIFEVPSGKVVGTSTFTTLHYAYTAADQGRWAYQLQVVADAFTGVGLPTTASGTAVCTGPCRMGRQRFPPQPVALHRFLNGEAYPITTISKPGQVGAPASTAWTVTFNNPAWTGPLTTGRMPAPNVRCDRALPGRTSVGCVFPSVTMGLLYSDTAWPQLASHVRRAQASGLPGAWPNGVPLTRLVNLKLQELNRRKACPSSRPRPKGKSCDEYPFASTNQGAYTGKGTARTFPGCAVKLKGKQSTGAKGYSVCMIHDGENGTAGTALGVFYNNWRILNRDKFLVGFTK